MHKPFNWKLFFILWIAGTFGVIAVIPYVLTLQSETLQNLELPIPFRVLIALQIVQGAVILGILTALGLLLANRIGLGAPIIEAWLNKESIHEKIKSILPMSIFLGVIAGVLIILLDAFVFQPLLVQELGEQVNNISQTAIKPPAWQGFLASFYGGIGEELQLRLFFMSLIAWLGSFISKPVNGKANNNVLWIANILAAIVFGVGHLPAAALISPLTTLVVIRIILLNSIGGIVFGWLYQTRGLESAMIAHFSADIVLHVIFAI